MRITITNGRENPGEVYAGAAAREKKIVVELILLGGWSKDCVPLMERTTVELSDELKTCPRSLPHHLPSEWEALLMNSV